MYQYDVLPYREKKKGKVHFGCAVIGDEGRHQIVQYLMEDTQRKHKSIFNENDSIRYYRLESAKYDFTMISPRDNNPIEDTIRAISQSHTAIVCISAEKVKESIASKGIARRDIMLCGALGITQILVVITNIEKIYHNATTFNELKTKCKKLLDASGVEKYTITSSDVEGENVVRDGDRIVWEKKTIIELLDDFDVLAHNNPMYVTRMSIADDRGFGIIDSGYINDGQSVMRNTMRNLKISLKSVNGHTDRSTAYAGDFVEFTLSKLIVPEGETNLEYTTPVGSVITDSNHPVRVLNDLFCRFMLTSTIEIGKDYTLNKGGYQVPLAPDVKKPYDDLIIVSNNKIAKCHIDGIKLIENAASGELSRSTYFSIAGQSFIGHVVIHDDNEYGNEFPHEHVRSFDKFSRLVFLRDGKIVGVGQFMPLDTSAWEHPAKVPNI